MYTLVFTLSNQPDTREFLISPFKLDGSFVDTSYSLKQIDIEFMRRLHTKVNLIPVIAKADTMTDEEIAEFKERVNTPVFPSIMSFSFKLPDSFRHCLPQYPHLPSSDLR